MVWMMRAMQARICCASFTSYHKVAALCPDRSADLDLSVASTTLTGAVAPQATGRRTARPHTVGTCPLFSALASSPSGTATDTGGGCTASGRCVLRVHVQPHLKTIARASSPYFQHAVHRSIRIRPHTGANDWRDAPNSTFAGKIEKKHWRSLVHAERKSRSSEPSNLVDSHHQHTDTHYDRWQQHWATLDRMCDASETD